MKFIKNKKLLEKKYIPLDPNGKASREDVEKKVIEGTHLVIERYRKDLVKLGNT